MKKVCCRCEIEKNIGDFRKDAQRTDGVQSWCRVCARSYHRSAYMEKYSEHSKSRGIRVRQAARELILQHKVQCFKCDEVDPICLEYHHIDPTTKLFTIGESIQRSETALLNEIAKCVTLCSNCHKKFHAGRFKL